MQKLLNQGKRITELVDIRTLLYYKIPIQCLMSANIKFFFSIQIQIQPNKSDRLNADRSNWLEDFEVSASEGLSQTKNDLQGVILTIIYYTIFLYFMVYKGIKVRTSFFAFHL